MQDTVNAAIVFFFELLEIFGLLILLWFICWVVPQSAVKGLRIMLDKISKKRG